MARDTDTQAHGINSVGFFFRSSFVFEMLRTRSQHPPPPTYRSQVRAGANSRHVIRALRGKPPVKVADFPAAIVSTVQ
jgi:hypothetical protein